MVSTAQSKRQTAAEGARLEARVSTEFKKTLERAAAVTGHTTLNSYVIATLRDGVSRDLESHAHAVLSAEESRAFVGALLNPPAPNKRLRTAFKRYREQTRAA